MYSIGDKVIYGENGVCEVKDIGPLEMNGLDQSRQYYTLEPIVGNGVYYTPVDSKVYMRSCMTKKEAEDFLKNIDKIEPAICHDIRFTHVDAFYKDLFQKHTCTALVALLKGIYAQEPHTEGLLTEKAEYARESRGTEHVPRLSRYCARRSRESFGNLRKTGSEIGRSTRRAPALREGSAPATMEDGGEGTA